MKTSIRKEDSKISPKTAVMWYLAVMLLICVFVGLMGATVAFADNLSTTAPYLSSGSCWVNTSPGEYLTTFVNIGENAGELGYSQTLNPGAIVSLGVMGAGETRLERLYGSELVYHWRFLGDEWRFQGTFEAINRGIDNDCRVQQGYKVPTSPAEFTPDVAQAVAECSLPVDHMVRQITLSMDSALYYAADETASTQYSLEAGKTVYLMDEYDHQFVKIWFACQELWIIR